MKKTGLVLVVLAMVLSACAPAYRSLQSLDQVEVMVGAGQFDNSQMVLVSSKPTASQVGDVSIVVWSEVAGENIFVGVERSMIEDQKTYVDNFRWGCYYCNGQQILGQEISRLWRIQVKNGNDWSGSKDVTYDGQGPIFLSVVGEPWEVVVLPVYTEGKMTGFKYLVREK